jgi:putative chitobiose transport system substrate-binding protein
MVPGAPGRKDARFGASRVDRRTFLTAAGAAVASAALAGLPACSPTAGRGTTLEFWTLALRPWFVGYIQGQLAAFERANPGVSVRWVDVPFEAADRKLIAAAGAGRAPDVVNLSDKTFARFVSAGAMVDLRPLLPADAAESYLPSALRLGEIGGRLLALPWYLTTQTVVANEGVLSVGGLSEGTLARRWSDLRTQATAFRAATGKHLFSVPLGQESDLPMMLLAEGEPPFRVEGGRLKADLTRPRVLGVLRDWVDLYRRGDLPREAATEGSAHLARLYQDGRIGVINTGPNFIKRIAQVAPAVFERTRSGPPITGAKGRAHIAVMTLCVTSQSRAPGLAARLALHMTGPAAQSELCTLADVLPSARATLDDPRFSGETAPGAEREPGGAAVARARAESARALRNAVAFTPSLAAWPEMRRAFEDRIKRVLLDGEPVETAMARVEREWVALLQESGETDAAAVPGLLAPTGGGAA